ncbi:hypothetical protein ACIGB6_10390 [Paeniglutamicibacter gangotriensis]|uniref:hypothetical protein n=1 Tax=Paeniglutamicibacter gangotriensis TaxID=254787 RepID=UPI0037CB27B0
MGGDELDEVTGRIQQVDTSATVLGVRLPGPSALRVGPVLDASVLDPDTDALEVGIVNQERIMLAWKVDGRLGKLQHHSIIQLDLGEWAPAFDGVCFGEFDEETCRGLGLFGGNDGVVEGNAHRVVLLLLFGTSAGCRQHMAQKSGKGMT